MKKLETKIKDCFIIETEVFGDSRGWFVETYSQEKFKSLGLTAQFVQDNHSYSSKAGIIRGIHLQSEPYSQSKLVRCIRGDIMDYIVDLRADSPSFGEYISVKLTERNHSMVLIPKGCGHAFETLTSDVEVEYKVDSHYNPSSEITIDYADPELKIKWQTNTPILSDKDKLGISFKMFRGDN